MSKSTLSDALESKAAEAVRLPAGLIEAVKNRRVVLFLGAGASMEARGPNGEPPPSSDRLRAQLGAHFLGDPLDGYDLMSVADMAISTAGQSVVFERIRTTLEPIQPSEAHLLVPTFRWRALATTNYDTLIERAYAKAENAVQHVVPLVKNLEPVEERLQSVQSPVLLIKLHGCVSHLHDEQIPLVLSHEHYALYARHRENLFNRLQALAHESTFVFIGYQLGDAHIRSILHRLAADGVKRPTYYIVTPHMNELEAAYWAKQNVEIIQATFGNFMRSLDAAVPELWRALDLKIGVEHTSVAKFFRSNSTPSQALAFSLDRDFTHLHGAMASDPQDPKQFYGGYDTGWGPIIQNLDVQRRMVNDFLIDAVLEEASDTECRFFLLRGPAGSGKTIALKRAAWEAATALDQLVLWFEDTGALRPDVLAELVDLTGKRIFVVIDRAALHIPAIDALLTLAKQRRLPITILAAERDSEWNTYGARVGERWRPRDYSMSNLSHNEIEELVDLLAKHESLGLLKSLSREQRIAAFVERADRQLLVALHEATRGKPFEEIVFDEYEGVVPEQARRLYLDICTLNQFGIPVRAGTISRVSGISFTDYRERLFRPLQNVVLTQENRYTGDIEYRARHPRVAEMVFQQACPTDEAKVDQLVRLIDQLDIGYAADRSAIEHIARGRRLREMVVGRDFGREIYQALLRAAPEEAFIYQQWAIFESLGHNASFEEAERLAKIARELEPNSKTIAHTQAEIARKRANAEPVPLLREQFRRQVRQRLNDAGGANSEFVLSSKTKLLVDEVNDLINSNDDVAALADKVLDAETEIRRAEQLYADSPDFFETEARLCTVLERTERALNALERAWNVRPRGSGIAIRLAKAYASRGYPARAKEILEEALSRNPEDRGVHYEMAKFLLSGNFELDPRIGEHLSRSYIRGDRNYEARHLHAQYLFMTGHAKEAQELFDEIDQTAPPEFRSGFNVPESLISRRLRRSSGRVARRVATSLYIHSGMYPKDIFASESHSGEEHWRQIVHAADVDFSVRFRRNGPVAFDVRVANTE